MRVTAALTGRYPRPGRGSARGSASWARPFTQTADGAAQLTVAKPHFKVSCNLVENGWPPGGSGAGANHILCDASMVSDHGSGLEPSDGGRLRATPRGLDASPPNARAETGLIGPAYPCR